jgi:hypothetical protein
VLLLLLLFVLRHLLLLVLFLIFLAAFVSHACSSFSGCDLKPGSLRGRSIVMALDRRYHDSSKENVAGKIVQTAARDDFLYAD